MQKLADQPLPLLAAVALTTAALVFGVMDVLGAGSDVTALMTLGQRSADAVAAVSALPAQGLP